MITELEKIDPAIVGGSKIRVVDYRIRNFRVHQVLEQVSRLLLFCLECDSNNTSSKAVPREVRNIRNQFNIVKDELEFSMTYNDFPRGSYEQAYTMSIIDQREVQYIRNVKVKRVVSEIWLMCQVMLGCDSANTQGFIAANDYADMKDSLKLVEAVLDRWIGSGQDAENTGINSPAFEILGSLRPDVDSDWAQVLEGSKDMPSEMLNDVPDTASVPATGANPQQNAKNYRK